MKENTVELRPEEVKIKERNHRFEKSDRKRIYGTF